jgi:predicted DNA-binding transcriptional regulator YafY
VIEVKKKYIRNKEIDFNEYFEDFVGVSLGNEGKLEQVILEVSNELLPYIQTKPIHGSQKLKERKELSSIISLDIIPNYELESLLLSLGEGLWVQKPISFKKRMKMRVQAMNNKYI